MQNFLPLIVSVQVINIFRLNQAPILRINLALIYAALVWNHSDWLKSLNSLGWPLMIFFIFVHFNGSVKGFIAPSPRVAIIWPFRPTQIWLFCEKILICFKVKQSIALRPNGQLTNAQLSLVRNTSPTLWTCFVVVDPSTPTMLQAQVRIPTKHTIYTLHFRFIGLVC